MDPCKLALGDSAAVGLIDNRLPAGAVVFVDVFLRSRLESATHLPGLVPDIIYEPVLSLMDWAALDITECHCGIFESLQLFVDALLSDLLLV